MIVGVLGGMGPAATVDFYAKLVAATPAARDQEHLAVTIWADPTVPDRSAALTGSGPDPTPWLRRGVARLHQAGAQLLAVPCNTAHAFVPALAEEFGLRLASIVDATARAVATLGLARVGLLATTGTVRSRLYAAALKPYAVELVVPDDERQCEVMAGISAVKASRIGAGAAPLADATRALAARGAQAVIAGCTEVVLALDAGSYGGTGAGLGRDPGDACAGMAPRPSASGNLSVMDAPGVIEGTGVVPGPDVPLLDPATVLAAEVVRIANEVDHARPASTAR